MEANLTNLFVVTAIKLQHITSAIFFNQKKFVLGDSFGITPTMDKLYHKGVMRTKCDDCQFVCVTQTDYYRILHQGEESQRRHEEDGRVVMVTENRANETDPNRRGHLVIKGTQQR